MIQSNGKQIYISPVASILLLIVLCLEFTIAGESFFVKFPSILSHSLSTSNLQYRAITLIILSRYDSWTTYTDYTAGGKNTLVPFYIIRWNNLL